MLSRLKYPLKDLTLEMLRDIPPSALLAGEIFDSSVAGGQQIKTIEELLTNAGQTDEYIANNVSGFAETVLSKNFAMNRQKLKAKIQVGGIPELEQLTKAKPVMGLCIGNPPYAGDAENTDTNLWVRFVKLNMDLLQDGGYLAFITPITWVGKNKVTAKADYSAYVDNQIVRVRFLSKKRSKELFPAASSTFCYYIIQKRPPTEPTIVEQEYEDGRIDRFLHTFQFTDQIYPTVVSPISVSIDEKLKKLAQLEVVTNNECHGQTLKKKNIVSDTKTRTLNKTVYFSHRITRYTSVESSLYSHWKIMIPTTGQITNAFKGIDCNFNEDIRAVIIDPSTVDPEKAADRALWLFTSFVLFRYIGKMYRPGRNLRVENLPLPLVDLTRDWDDKSLLDALGFTEDEQAYIIANS